jgi:transcriptional regulator of arginine metabolism
MKTYRQAALLDLIDREPIRSQDMLRRRLKARGLEVTQATISRDIKELGLVKGAADGAYHRAGREPAQPAHVELALRRAILEYLRSVGRVQWMVVLKTDPGQAQPLALAIDRAAMSEVAGTLAGDDTILVVAQSERAARTLVRRFEEWARA